MKAVLQFRASAGFQDRLRQLSPEWLHIVVVDEGDKAAFALEMRDTEVLLHVLEPVTADVIAAAPKLKLIHKIGVGVNTIDLDAARAHGVAVANMPGTNSQAVAEITLALLLATLRKIVVLDRAIRQGKGWSLDRDALDGAGEIHGRTVGLVGYGEIPRRLAPVLLALGARVCYTSRTPKPNAAGEWQEFPELLRASDVVSLHVPLTPETERMMNRTTFAQMKPGSVLINTARGGLVDEAALLDALQSGQLRGAGLDVLATEPAPATNPLLQLENVVVTPHVAWLTPETLERSLHVAVDNCDRLVQGLPLVNQVIP